MNQLVLYAIYTVVALFVAFMVIDYVAHRIRLRRLRKEAYSKHEPTQEYRETLRGT